MTNAATFEKYFATVPQFAVEIAAALGLDAPANLTSSERPAELSLTAANTSIEPHELAGECSGLSKAQQWALQTLVEFDWAELGQSTQAVQGLLAKVSLRAERGLARAAERARQADANTQAEAWQNWSTRCLDSALEVYNRANSLGADALAKSIQRELPVSAALAEIGAALEDHQVVVVAGETGSGKTTQLPKLLLQLGYGQRGRIAHTQPRRLAARTVASRIASELDTALGNLVGYQFRFESQLSEASRLLLVTDGLLLSQIGRDRYLRDYDAIIIDEAHERSLNIDFLLGYLKSILPLRPELRIIVTSATIDVQSIAKFFDGAPVVEVGGRGYPIEIRYQLSDDVANAGGAAGSSSGKPNVKNSTKTSAKSNDKLSDSVDDGLADGSQLAAQVEAVLDEVRQLERDGVYGQQARDLLVFLPGEREIRDLRQQLLGRSLAGAGEPEPEVIPLYARLSRAEQEKVFRRGAGARRLVLATNVAETSVTVPGIGYVIDTGVARISRYSMRSKLQRLQVEKVSQASAGQRAGRCGRLGPGVCFRLYSESDFDQRSPFTDPEILRTQLADVILKMKSLDLGDVYNFPFIDPPERRQINSGLQLLEELKAVAPRRSDGRQPLTRLGENLARLPLDPRLGSIVLAASAKRCLAELVVIVAALAVVDPREWPQEKRQQATQLHRRFDDSRSEFLSWLNLWRYIETQRQRLSSSQFRKLCKQEYLSWIRLREWRNTHRQILLAVESLEQRGAERREQKPSNRRGRKNAANKPVKKVAGEAKSLAVSEALTARSEADVAVAAMDAKHEDVVIRYDWQPRYELIHRALITGLYPFFGRRDEDGFYRGARNVKFRLFANSKLAKTRKPWLLAAEIIETNRVYARCIAVIEPQWLVAELRHLLKYEYAEPYWDARRGQVLIPRSSRLYGLRLGGSEPVSCEKIDAPLARQTFIREALVARALGDSASLREAGRFWAHNEQLLNDIADAEQTLRKKDAVYDELQLEAFYQRGLPAAVCSRQSLIAALEQQGDVLERALMLSRSSVNLLAEQQQRHAQFPAELRLDGNALALQYSFSPESDADGVSCEVPLAALVALPAELFEWLVPGLLLDKVIAMIKLLPKATRRKLVPVPAVSAELLDGLELPDPGNLSSASPRGLFAALVQRIQREYGVAIDGPAWRESCNQQLAAFYRMHFRVVDDSGKLLAAGRELNELKQAHSQRVASFEQSVEQGDSAAQSEQLAKRWPVPQIGRAEVATQRGEALSGFPVLRDHGDGVQVGLEVDRAKAFAINRRGVLRLAAIKLADSVRYLKKNLLKDSVRLLGFSVSEHAAVSSRAQLVDDCIRAALLQACFTGGLPSTEGEFESGLAAGRGKVTAIAQHLEQAIYEIAESYQQLQTLLQKKAAHFPAQCRDIEAQLALLLGEDFILDTPYENFLEIPRYLAALVYRLDRIGENTARGDEYCEKLSSYQQNLQQLLYQYPEALFFDEKLAGFRWLLEELRVALFAQHLKTKVPASFKRLESAWQQVDLLRYDT